MGKVCERYIDQGCGVILLSIPKRASATNTFEVISYNKIIESVAQYYNSPYIDITDTTLGYECEDVYSDNDGVWPLEDRIHFNEVGYSLIATDIFSNLISLSLNNYVDLTEEGMLSSYPYASAVFRKGKPAFEQLKGHSGDIVVCENKGYAAIFKQGQSITYSFKTTKPMMLIPQFKSIKASQLEITLDGGIQQSNSYMPSMLTGESYILHSDNIAIGEKNLNDILKSTYTFEVGTRLTTSIKSLSKNDVGNNIIPILKPGSHIITVKNIGSDTVEWYGLQAYEFQDGYDKLKD